MTTMQMLQPQFNAVMRAEVAIGTPVNTQPFCNVVEAIGLMAPLQVRDLFLWQPGQYFYNNLKFDNEVLITTNFVNLDAANTFRVNIHLLIETEE